MSKLDIDTWITLSLAGKGANPYKGELGLQLTKIGVHGPWQGDAKSRSAFVPEIVKRMQKEGYSIRSHADDGLKEVRLFQHDQPTNIFVRKALLAGERSMPRDAVPLHMKTPGMQPYQSIGLAANAKTAVGTTFNLAAQSTKPVTAGSVPASQAAATLGLAGFSVC